MVYFLISLATILFLVWFVVTQPFTGATNHDTKIDVSNTNLRRHVYTLSETLPPRAPDPAALDIAAAYIRSEFTRHSDRVRDQEFQVEGKTFRNVIARFGPATGPRIVVGAHYDTAGGLPGADDNASGVAGLIELTRVLGSAPPPTAVDVVAFTLEEVPFFRTGQMGSAVHAQALRTDAVNVKLMLSLEMIGYFDDRPNSQSYPMPLLKLFYPSTGNFIAVVGNLSQLRVVRNTKRIMSGATALPVYSLNGPSSIPGVDFSDHVNYWHQGFPAAMITDTAFYRNSAYHSPEDTADRLDYDRMAQVVQGVAAVIYEFPEVLSP